METKCPSVIFNVSNLIIFYFDKMRTPCTSICFGGKDGILTKSAFNMWKFMLLWINILYYNHSCRKMLNDIANMTLSYKNMVLFVCDRIGSIVLLLVLVCILLFSSPTALIMPLQRFPFWFLFTSFRPSLCHQITWYCPAWLLIT